MAPLPAIPDLAERVLTPELMDDPALAAREHETALAGLRRVNLASRTAPALWRRLARIACRRGGSAPDRPLRVLDIATGSADVPIALARLAARRDLKLDLAACDISPRAVGVAQSRIAAAGAPVHAFVHDAVRDGPPEGFDVLICSLFLHHLDAADAQTLLRRMGERARVGVLVSDLRRTRAGYALAYAASRLFAVSRVMRTDALLSVRAAFTIPELAEMAARAGLAGATIAPAWPQRVLLAWERPE